MFISMSGFALIFTSVAFAHVWLSFVFLTILQVPCKQTSFSKKNYSQNPLQFLQRIDAQ